MNRWKNVCLKEDEELVSFDVVSLFTSIPVKLAIQVAKDLLSNDDTLQDRTTIPVDDIVGLLDFCLSSTNFKYNNNHYQQIFGTAMGSPVSAVTANLVMEDLEKRALSTSLSQPCFRKRYVDDLCAAVKSNLVLTLQNHLNNIEPSIQFTVERETERKISFLDVTVCRQDDGQLSTKVYRKPTHTERYLSFDSHHPIAHKRAVIKSLTDRQKRFRLPLTNNQRKWNMWSRHSARMATRNALLLMQVNQNGLLHKRLQLHRMTKKASAFYRMSRVLLNRSSES